MKIIPSWLNSNSDQEQKTTTLKNKLSYLIDLESDVRKELEFAEIQPGKKRRKAVDNWFIAVKRIKAEVQSVLIDSQALASSSKSQSTRIIDRLIGDIDELNQRSKFPNGLLLSDHESLRLPLLLGTKPVGQGFEKNSEKILGWLQNQETCIICVYGMGGVGKTTLLMHIHDHLLRNLEISGLVYWVTVSQECSVEKLQKYIAKVLNVDLSEVKEKKKRASLLHKTFIDKGPSVLILDDMWKEFLRDDVGIPLEGSRWKIILSTRSLEVCRRMGCKTDFIVKADVLSEIEAWNFFVDKLGHYETLCEEAKRIAEHVAQKCGGLPLAISIMARSMSGITDILDWKNVYNELNNARGQEDMQNDVLSTLKVSYDFLNDETIQNCFLSCILYPEDYRISRVKLINIWIYEGIFDEIDRRDDQVTKGHSILNRFENLCLLESSMHKNGKDKCVKMHDLIRDMAVMITKTRPCFMAKSRLQLMEVPEEKQWSRDLVKVSLSHNRIKEIPCGLTPVTPQLRVLLLCNNDLKDIPESFFMHMRSLVVLDLSSNFRLQRLPESISCLKNLRAILLEKCEQLQYVPSIANLTQLRILRLPYTSCMLPLPKSIESLKHLQEITLYRCVVNDVICFNKVVELSLKAELVWNVFVLEGFDNSLEYYDSFSVWADSFDDDRKAVLIKRINFNAEKNSMIPVLPNSAKLLKMSDTTIDGWQSLDDFMPSLFAAKELEMLALLNCAGLEYIFTSAEAMQYSPKTLTRPRFSSCLKELFIKECPKLKVVHLFPNLEKLNLESCKELKEIIVGEYSCSYLRRLYIDGCPKLTAVPVFSNLEKLTLTDCAGLEIVSDGQSEGRILINDTANLLKLSGLWLRNLPKLRNYWVLLVQTLEELKLSGCLGTNTNHTPIVTVPSLKSLQLERLSEWSFVPQNLLCSSSIEELSIISCDMAHIFGAHGFSLSNLRYLYVYFCDKLKVLFPYQLLLVPNLEKLWVFGCKSLEVIFDGGSRHDQNLCDSMELFKINSSGEEEIPKPILQFPNLVELYLSNLPELRSIYRGLLICTSLSYVSVDECSKLITVPLKSEHLICDASLTTMLSIPEQDDNPQLWELLHREYPEDAHLLSDLIHKYQLKRKGGECFTF